MCHAYTAYYIHIVGHTLARRCKFNGVLGTTSVWVCAGCEGVCGCHCVCVSSRRPLIGPWEWTSCPDREPNAYLLLPGDGGGGVESPHNGARLLRVVAAKLWAFRLPTYPPPPIRSV